MTSKSALLLVVLLPLISVSHATEVATTPPFVHQLYVPKIPNPRSLILDPAGDILVSSRTAFNITAIRETNHGNGTSTVETTLIFNGTDLSINGLNHGIAYHNGFLYASSSSDVYRWSYTPGQFSLLNNSTLQVVITNITATTAGHITRTLVFDDAGRLYVQVGSLTNIDDDSYRSRIRRFNLGQQLPIQFTNGEVFADGLRNTVGIGFSTRGTLFGVDNGYGGIQRPDLDEVVALANPADEMNKFSNPGTHYGYPYCWSSYNITGYPRGTQFVEPKFQNDGVHTDEWCQNVNNNAPPVVFFPAYSAPLSIAFYNGTNCGVNGGFPCSSIGDAFVSLHSTGTNVTNYGYKVSWYPFNKELELPTGEMIEVLFSSNPTVTQCTTCLRPVNAVFNKDGHLIVSSDVTNEIYRVAYDWTLPVITNVHHDVSNSVRSIYSKHLLSFALFMIFARILFQCFVQ